MKHIYYRNDFAVEVELFNLEGVKVSPPEWQWSIEFSDSRKKYVCSLEKGNAEVMDDGSVMCYLDNHNFYCGRLSCKFKEQIPNLSYLDGFQRVIRPTDIDIELWDKPSDNDGNVSVSVIPDYVIYDAWNIAKANGYSGTQEEFYTALNDLPKTIETAESVLQNTKNLADDLAEKVATDYYRGEKGDKGDKGEQGIQGLQGLQGIQGEKGEKGDKGDTGNQGPIGQTGPQGKQGAKGIQGEKGADGFSPIVSLTKDGSISTLSITDAQGEHTTEIADGAKGDDGFSPIVSLNKVDKVTTLTITDAQGTHTATVNDGESVNVVQSTGNSTTSVMSQKAVSDALSTKADKTELDSYATKEYVQTNAPQENKESIEEKLGAWLEEDGGEADGEVYTKAESDARYLRGEVLYEDYYYPNMSPTTDTTRFTDSTEILQPTKFIESYTDADGTTWSNVFECESFPDWFEFSEKECYPYGNGYSVGYLFLHNFDVENNGLVYNFDTLQNNNIGQKLPYYADRNGLGLKKIDSTHFKVYNEKEGTTEFTAMDKTHVDCSLFAFSPVTYNPIYDVDDCKSVRITLTGNIQSPSRYSSLLNGSCDVGLFGYNRRQVLYGDEYVEIEIDKNNNRWRQVKSGYSMFYRSSNSQNWNNNKPESYESECRVLWSNIPNGTESKICMINNKVCYSFSRWSNPLTLLQMGCKIKIEKLA